MYISSISPIIISIIYRRGGGGDGIRRYYTVKSNIVAVNRPPKIDRLPAKSGEMGYFRLIYGKYEANIWLMLLAQPNNLPLPFVVVPHTVTRPLVDDLAACINFYDVLIHFVFVFNIGKCRVWSCGETMVLLCVMMVNRFVTVFAVTGPGPD